MYYKFDDQINFKHHQNATRIMLYNKRVSLELDIFNSI